MRKVTLRNLLARKLRLVMSAFAIILGVAFVSASFIFTDTIQRTFDNISAGTVPNVTVRFAGAEGGSPDIEMMFNRTTQAFDDERIESIESIDGVERADGSIEGMGAFVVDSEGDLLGGQGAPTLSFTYNDAPNMFGDPIIEFSAGDPPGAGEIVLDTPSAENAGYEVGDTVPLILPGEESSAEMRLSGTADLAGGGSMAGATMLMFDDGTAQDIFLNGVDGYTSVLVQASEGTSDAELADRIEADLPDGQEAITGDEAAEEFDDSINEFLGFLNTFLLIFAGIALVVGTFLIINTFSILVAQRSRELALLRAMGASSKQVNRSVLAEAGVVGLVGSAIGLVTGYGLSFLLRWLFGMFGLDISGTAMVIDWRTVVAAFAVGVPVTVFAALLPARRASRIPPIAALRDDVALPELQIRRRVMIGAALTVAGAGLMMAGLAGVANGPVLTGGGILAILIGVAFLSPLLAKPVIGVVGRIVSRTHGAVGHLAMQNTLRNPRRTAATASALMIGVALVTTMAVLGSSMNQSVEAGVEEEFSMDFLISDVGGFGQPFSASIAEDVRAIDGVGVVASSQLVAGSMDGEQAFPYAVDVDAFNEIFELEMLDGEADVSLGQIALREDLAEDRGAGVGDTLTFNTSTGEFDLEVAGVYDDTNVVGQAILPMEFIAEADIQRTDVSVSVMAEDGADSTEVEAAVKEELRDTPLVTVQNQEEFAEGLKAQVNQILFMIYALLGLAIIIAVLGIINTLALSVIERTREIGLLRAVGMTRRQLRRMVRLESVAIALFGALLGTVMGVVFGIVLQRSLADEGITHLNLPLLGLGIFFGLSALFGVLAALLPARRAAKQNVLEAISTE